jgi:hypothetical protein
MSDWMKKWLEKNVDNLDGIDITKLPPKTKIIVDTKNSIYDIIVVDGKNIICKGGTHMPQPVTAHLNGSTWGGSALWLGWINFMMRMEIAYGKKLLTTSPVERATVIGPDESWSYDLDWPHPSYPE